MTNPNPHKKIMDDIKANSELEYNCCKCCRESTSIQCNPWLGHDTPCESGCNGPVCQICYARLASQCEVDPCNEPE